MATPFDATPTWFEAEFYLETKLAKLIAEDPKGNWTRPSMLEAFAAADFANPYDHYLAYGDIEGLSPNRLFNNAEYLAGKTVQMGTTWTSEMVAKAIADAGMTLMQHYEQFGSAEGISPSSAFNQNKYYEAKLEQVQTAEPDKAWTLESLKAAFAAANLTPLDHYLAYAKTEGLDKHDYSDNGAPIPHPGNNIALTAGADTATPDAETVELRTSAKDDIISGVVSSLTAKGTFTAGDVIDGGAGVDTLTLDMQGDFNFKSGSVKNVEEIVLNNAAGRSFDAKGVEAADIYAVNGGDKTSTVTIKNVDSADTDYSLKQEAGTFKVQVVDGALTGKTDNVQIALNGVGTDSADAKRVTLDIGGTSTTTGKVEGLTLLAEGKDSFVTLKQGHTTAAIMGAGTVDIKVDSNMETFDASDATGKITANLNASLGTLKTINGGATNDTFTLNGALLNTAVVDGGDGADTLKFGTLTTGAAIKSTITGVETFEVTAASSTVAVGFDLSKVEGLETIKIDGAGVTTSKFAVTKATAYDAMNLQLANELTIVPEFAYDGNGVLNLSLVGDKADVSGTGTTLTSLVAKNITDLTLTNNAEAGELVIAGVDARNVTSLTLSGESAIGFTYQTSTATPSKLSVVNATGFEGVLTLDLSKATVAEDVTITMGDGGSSTRVTTSGNTTGGLIGTGKADTFNLGLGSESVVLAENTAPDLADIINNFGSDDVIAGTVASTSVIFTNVDRSAGTLIAFAADAGLVLTDTGSTKAVDLAMTKFFAAKTNAAKISAADVMHFAIDNGTDIGIYKVTFAATIAASAAATIGSITSGIQLMGIVTDTDLSALTSANFAA